MSGSIKKKKKDYKFLVLGSLYKYYQSLFPVNLHFSLRKPSIPLKTYKVICFKSNFNEHQKLQWNQKLTTNC